MIFTVALAFSQTVSGVPAGARAVTVYACTQDCDEGWRALTAWANVLRLPTLDFDQVAVSARDDRLDAFDLAMVPLRRGEYRAEHVVEAQSRLAECPYTIPTETLFLLALASAATAADPEGAARALTEAANVGERRAYNLPALPEDTIRAYLTLVGGAPELLAVSITADSSASTVYVNGRSMGVAPLTLSLPRGPHRITVERPGRQTAFVAQLYLETEGTVHAELAANDSNAALERLVLAAMDGLPASETQAEPLTRWARDEGLEWVRFVTLDGRGDAEVIPSPEPGKPGWRVRDVYLDVARGRLVPNGPGTNAMIAAADVERFRVGAAGGYLFLAPRDHVSLDFTALYRFDSLFSADLRLGVAHSAQPYYLYDDWIDAQVYPVSAGLRVGRPEGGPYAGAAALAVIPYALGGELRAGWDFAPSFGWRVALEARGGLTDKGWLTGVGIGIASRR